ncbi:type II toxin-antitoxin system death-on-curing family toxin [Shewanella algae]|uniref:type II toxin-antitoxin system death-on-curing family toxin n=1 Tax=Shewanella algae TaxID=38313 RepID=UPI0031F55E80|nr:type II toxin-antitoxin system death-on-curing family toxin [Shewanella algae]
MLKFLGVDDVIDIHDSILASEPGSKGAYLDRVDAVVGRIEREEDYQGFESAFHLAAAYIEAFAVGHAFVDGNKRTAFACGMIILEMNGFPVPDEIKDAMGRDSSAWSQIVVKLVERKINRGHLINLMMFTYLATAGAIGIVKLTEWIRDKLSD